MHVGWKSPSQIIIRCLVPLLGLAATSSSALGQGDTGFLRGKGNLDFVLSYSLDTYDEFWIGDDKISDAPFGRVDRNAINGYLAYGLTDDIDITASMSWVYVETDDVFDDNDAL